VATPTAILGALKPAVDTTLARLAAQDAVGRIWGADPGLWKPGDAAAAASITNRLGWLHSPTWATERADELTAFVNEVQAAGYTDAVLLGMGGSSLAPEVIRRTLGVASGHLELHMLDTTDPASILAVERRVDLNRALFLVSSKSGTTIETSSLYRYFWQQVSAVAATPGEHFVAIADAGTAAEREAAARGFRRCFVNPGDIGGRYSALSYFGLMPAALLGVDLSAFLQHAVAMAAACGRPGAAEDNPGRWLGAVMATAQQAGRDKLTLVCSPGLASFGYWAEQLVAESTGKEGTGILPVEGEPLGDPRVYGADRVFVYLGLAAERDEVTEGSLAALGTAGHPVVFITLDSVAELGAEFYRWEFATAIAAVPLGINPFDEPNVQESKDATNTVLAALPADATVEDLPEPSVAAQGDGVRVADTGGHTPLAALVAFLNGVRPGDYLATTAYVPNDAAHQQALGRLRHALRDVMHVATTVGFGPRFLHSTGQYHKGGPASGVFIQIACDDPEDMPVPDAPYSFGLLKRAQALGDWQALQAHGRHALRLHLSGDSGQRLAALDRLTVALVAARSGHEAPTG